MRITIYFKDGTVIKDCLITSVDRRNNGSTLFTTDFYNKITTYDYDEIALIIMHD